MNIFVTGGPRNGTTLIMQLIVALGYKNGALNIDLGNFEDYGIRNIVDEILSSRKPYSKNSKKKRFDKYFKRVLKKNKSSQIALKYPLLSCTPSPVIKKGFNHIEMVENNLYGEFISSVSENFDLILYCYRDPLKAAKSELNFFKNALNHNLNESEKKIFFQNYCISHEKTSERIKDYIQEKNEKCKIINLNFDDLVSSPSEFILDLSENINSRSNSLVLKWLSDYINKDGFIDGHKRNPTLAIMSTFFGQLNNYASCFKDNKRIDNIFYKENLTNLYKHLNKYKF